LKEKKYILLGIGELKGLGIFSTSTDCYFNNKIEPRIPKKERKKITWANQITSLEIAVMLNNQVDVNFKYFSI